jgi:hypothetical protein
MSHYMDFDPYLIRGRNEQIRDEVNSLRLKKQLRKTHNLHGLQIAALGEWGRILIGRAKLTQDPSPHSGAILDGAGIGEHFNCADGSSGLCDVASAGIRGRTQDVR